MPAKIYRVTLTTDEQEDLTALVSKGQGAVRRITRARILLMADENRADGGWKDADIAQALGGKLCFAWHRSGIESNTPEEKEGAQIRWLRGSAAGAVGL